MGLSRSIGLVWGVCALLLTSAAWAQDGNGLRQEALRCSEQPSANAKAACFEALTTRLGECKSKETAEAQVDCYLNAADIQAKSPSTDSLWVQSESVDKLDGSKSIVLSLISSDAVLTDFGQQKHGGLFVRCRKNTTEVLIAWPSYLGSTEGHQVKWRTDKDPIVTEWWQPSTDGAAVFSSSAIPFAKKLLGRTELVVSLAPYSKGPQTLSFPISGLEAAIKPLREACKW
ncbi:MAG TPA: type VI secretion system-associated protein TagO [Reyranella sp.]|nr:type VI secretion system-associated protein TagO [Reyranella sp.]